MTSRTLYFRVLRCTKPYTYIAVLAASCMVIAGGVDAVMMRLLKSLIDGFEQLYRSQHPLWWMPAILFGLGGVRLITSFGYEYLSTWLASRVMQDLRDQVFARLICMPVKFFDQSSTGVLLSRVTFDINQIMDTGLNVLTVIMRDSALALGLLIVMLWTDWQLTLFCFIMLPGTILSVRIVSKRQRQLSHTTQNTMGEMTQILDESLSGQRVVKIFGGQSYERNRFARANKQVRQLNVKRTATSSFNSGFSMLLIAIAISALIYFAGVRAQAGLLTAGSFVSFMSSMLLLQQPIKNLSKINDQLHRGLAAAESVFAMIDQEPEYDCGTHHVDRAIGKIEYRNVSFYYTQAENKALHTLHLTIDPGETIAFVGPSGSGKTTLVNLLPRFYEPTEGEILLDDIPLPNYKLQSLRRQIAIVSQDVILFNDTVAANIAYGAEQIDQARVLAAATAAHALDFIEKMPGQFNAILGENGIRLSGGQRQRIAIARALYKNAPILILDEATSALDTKSERYVQEALENLMQGRTTLIIAHRLSTIQNADRIVVLKQGKIVEIGHHEELLAAGGIYSHMHAIQPRESKEDTQ